MQQVKGFGGLPSEIEIKGGRPGKPQVGKAGFTHYDYREKLAEYIKENTGIELPVSATINSHFYEAVANYCKLP